jgi:tRNA (guanine37-N1)-methyltransferase
MMRHLSVPRNDTALWIEYLSKRDWLAASVAIQDLGARRGIPLNQSAPLDIKGLPTVDLEPKVSGPKHWTDRLPQNLFERYSDIWPTSNDQLGDLVILKIPDEVKEFKDEIGKAILAHSERVRLVCEDKGVKGEFRVRDLQIIASRDGTITTRTQVKEHSKKLWIDPAKAYYSPRLGTERLNTFEEGVNLSKRLSRPIVICDPYAGVGPNLSLFDNEDFVEMIIASDLNPDAVELLKLNLSHKSSISCSDARQIAEKHKHKADLLLVNLPHDSIDHLPSLLTLLARGHEVMIRGWAIISKDKITETKTKIKEIIQNHKIIELDIVPIKSYSPQDEVIRFQIRIHFNE